MTDYQPKDQSIETTLSNDDFEVTVIVRWTTETGEIWEEIPGQAVAVPVADAARDLYNALIKGERG